MRVDEFDFELPERLIALRPAVPRDSARLLVVREDGAREHHNVRDLLELLQPKDLLVVNDSKVIAARLHGVRHRAQDQNGPGAKIELLLHRRIGPGAFRALARPAKRLAPGDLLIFGPALKGRVNARNGAEIEILFEQHGDDLDRAIAVEGEVPLPPYIAGKRTPDRQDVADYQTIYARISGSVAAPTAGLHFTPDLLQALRTNGVGLATVTLHVGPGTFLPVTADDTDAHVMHSESAELPVDVAAKINDVRARGGRVVAVGSTALRTLEAASDEEGRIHPFNGDTNLFITPGYRFKAVNVLLTNFHLPRSTLFMLVCAFSGTAVMKAAYADAIERRYRFYSYGDACLLFRARSQ
jgi:S-adenosylmethionine:tRNA ribosyltransferase-isomerase